MILRAVSIASRSLLPRSTGNAPSELRNHFVESIRQDWDTGDLNELVDRVYETWPKYAEKSVIRDKVAQRTERRRAR